MGSAAYFERIDDRTFRPTEHATGAWNPDEQHICPALGLMVHCVEFQQSARRPDDLQLGRLSYDIYGTVPVAAFTIDVEVLRPGRTIELVRATLTHEGRTIVDLRAWYLRRADSSAVAGHFFDPLPSRDEMPPFDLSGVWPGGLIASAEMRSVDREPGRARSWIRPRVPLLAGEEISPVAAASGLLDIANGIAVRAEPGDVMFANIDLSAHFFRQPATSWLGFDTGVAFGPDGVGETHTVLHDETGPVGTIAQCLTVRPRTAGQNP